MVVIILDLYEEVLVEASWVNEKAAQQVDFSQTCLSIQILEYIMSVFLKESLTLPFMEGLLTLYTSQLFKSTNLILHILKH